MALAPDIVDILTRATEAPHLRAVRSTASDPMAGFFADIARTILPRTFHVASGPQGFALAHVANRRVQNLALDLGLAPSVPVEQHSLSRDAQLHQTACALVKLILASDDLTVTVALSASNADPDDFAFSATELSAACAALGYSHQTGSLTLFGALATLGGGAMHIGPDGKVVGDQDGSAGAFGVTEAQHMAAGLSDLRADLHADLRDVLGDEVLLYLPGKDDQGLLVALNPEAAQVSAVLSADLDLALQLWRRRGGP